MTLAGSIRGMITGYEKKLQHTTNISMRDIIEDIIENLKTLLNQAESSK